MVSLQSPTSALLSLAQATQLTMDVSRISWDWQMLAAQVDDALAPPGFHGWLTRRDTSAHDPHTTLLFCQGILRHRSHLHEGAERVVNALRLRRNGRLALTGDAHRVQVGAVDPPAWFS